MPGIETPTGCKIQDAPPRELGCELESQSYPPAFAEAALADESDQRFDAALKIVVNRKPKEPEPKKKARLGGYYCLGMSMPGML